MSDTVLEATTADWMLNLAACIRDAEEEDPGDVYDAREIVKMLARRSAAAEARTAELEAGLRPFAEYAAKSDGYQTDHGWPLPDGRTRVAWSVHGPATIAEVFLDDCRRAAALLGTTGEAPGLPTPEPTRAT